MGQDKSNRAFPFNEPGNVAVFTLKTIVFGGDPILHVTHDSDDSTWQFLGGGDAEEANAALISLSEILSLDPTIAELADLPLGWHAWRRSKNEPWQRATAK
ncbi:MAG: DUF2185 domain-containing protein [Planctomycetota bacterium]|nr:DUF2185 domain-containing protein [Planctomycetota bacterium]